MRAKGIPTVDLSEFVHGNASQRQQFVAQLGDAFTQTGFVAVKHHGIPADLIQQFYAASQAFFALPETVKRQYEIAGLAGQRGYTSFGKEHAKHSHVADLKEFFQLGQENAPADEYVPNVHVRECAEFTATGLQLYRAFEVSGSALLRAISLFLGLAEGYFDPFIRGGNSILRAIHYPPITTEPASAIRAESHEDINLITLLVGASAGGLQLLTAAGEWLDIAPDDDELVVNVGDMLQRLTNNCLKSTTHRVVNPPREQWHLPRLSIPFFLHPLSAMSLDCLPECVSQSRPKAYAPITAGSYLNERLREIGLKN